MICYVPCVVHLGIGLARLAGPVRKVEKEIMNTLKEYGIRTCYYGHLHGNAIRYAVQGEVDGIRYKLVSADGLRFCPYRIN